MQKWYAHAQTQTTMHTYKHTYIHTKHIQAHRQDFCEASEEEQLRVLIRVHGDPEARKQFSRPLQPQERFNRIDRRVKALLKVLLCAALACCSMNDLLVLYFSTNY